MFDDEEILDLLDWIVRWMVDNDYECGREGAELFEKVSDMIDRAIP